MLFFTKLIIIDFTPVSHFAPLCENTKSLCLTGSPLPPFSCAKLRFIFDNYYSKRQIIVQNGKKFIKSSKTHNYRRNYFMLCNETLLMYS